MKILYVTTIGMTMTFFRELIRDLMDQGNCVDIVCNEEIFPVPECYREWGCKIFRHDCARTPFSFRTLKAIGQIRRIVREEKYDIVHCHTPVASICARLACAGFRKKGLKVIYTAHGFHFYKGAPLLNWLLYYPAEKFCAAMTDVLITINQEDYALAKKKLRVGSVEHIPGVGVDTGKFARTVVDRAAKRRELGIPEDAFLLASVGELNINKNHQVILRAMAQLNRPDIHYVIAGEGPQEKNLRNLAKELGLEKNLHLIGFREDIPEICKSADLFCFPSIREGLGLAAVEAMAAGLCVIAADNRGTREFMTGERESFLFRHDNVTGFASAILAYYEKPNLIKEMSAENVLCAKKFDVYNMISIMRDVYDSTEKK